MSYLFQGRAEDVMRSFLEDLVQAATSGPARESYFQRALIALVGLHERAARAGAPSPERLSAFRRDSALALEAFSDLIAAYAADTCDMAEGANDDEWPELCIRRSVIQVLLDDYAGTGIAALIDREDLAELDEELRRVGKEQGPSPATTIPPGLSAEHWWWCYPETAVANPSPGVRVLDPDLAYTTLRERLESTGWRCVDASNRSIVPGESEFALFERREGERLAYSFNPVCRLRLLEGPADLATDSSDLLPAVAPFQVLDWLRGPDERNLLRGILAARKMPTPALLARVDILRGHAHTTIAKAAAEAAEAMRASVAGPVSPPADEKAARGRSLAAIELLEQQLEPLLLALGQDSESKLAAGLAPRPEDYACAFQSEAVEVARRGYAALWAAPPRVTPAHPDSRLEIHIAPAGMLADDNELSWHFPRGYRSIAHLLDPHRVWVAWKLIPPGQDAGMAYDGLVWLDDHWVWFPKPYRLLAELAK